MPRHDFVVCIGRFEPFHFGHLAALRRALEVGGRVIVLVGSAGAPRSARHPWSWEERAGMIRAAMGEEAGRLILRPLVDHLYNETAWVGEVQAQVAAAIAETGHEGAASVGLIGEGTEVFPQWSLVDVERVAALSPAALRQAVFAPAGDGLLEASVPPAVLEALQAFRRTAAFDEVADEWRHVLDYRKAWAKAPYPPTFVTADAVVEHSGHVLLIQRRSQPGKGLWALPGGFVNQDETLLAAAIRELREETRLTLPEAVLRDGLKGQGVFDDPDRSMRGRTITHAFHFAFPSGPLPAVTGSDDAARATWLPVAEVMGMRGELFEDHYFILERLLGG